MRTQKHVDALVSELERSFGTGAVSRGSAETHLNVISTGSLALDFTLGTGGWPRGHFSGVYGVRDIGKSSVIGFNAIRSAQAEGLNAAIIAVEPHFDKEWAKRHGVDIDSLIIGRPDTGEAAFHMLHKLTTSGVIDLVVFDSIGALLASSEIDEKGTMRPGGQAGLITWGLKRCIMPIYKNNVCCILLNQVRDNMSSRIAHVFQQPGGNAIEHLETIICELRRSGSAYTAKVNDVDTAIGYQIVVHIKRNKLTDGSNQRVTFDFYSADVDGYPFGIDKFSDVVNTAQRVGVVKRKGAWYYLPDATQHNGLIALSKYLAENTLVYELVRSEVLNRIGQLVEEDDGSLVPEVSEQPDAQAETDRGL